MKVKVLKPFKMHKVGKVVDIPDKLADLMLRLGKCEKYIEPPKPKRRGAKKKVAVKKSETVITPKPAEVGITARGGERKTYSTKVITAE